jgi:hypothetical protein
MVGLGTLSSGLIFDYLNKRSNILRIITFLLVAYTFFVSNPPYITPAKVKEFLSLPAEERTIARHAPFNLDIYVRQEYGYWTWINNNISGGDVVGYTFEPLFLAPLWNRSFSNGIVYIRVDTHDSWLQKIKENQVTHILIKKNSLEDKWFLARDFEWLDKFGISLRMVYADKNYKILMVER